MLISGFPIMHLTLLIVVLRQGLTEQCWKLYSCLYKDSDRTHGLKNQKRTLLNEVVHIINNLYVGHVLYQALAASSSKDKDKACCLIHIFD